LDELPSTIANTADAILWIALLFGWIGPLTWGFMSLMRPKRKA